MSCWCPFPLRSFDTGLTRGLGATFGLEKVGSITTDQEWMRRLEVCTVLLIEIDSFTVDFAESSVVCLSYYRKIIGSQYV